MQLDAIKALLENSRVKWSTHCLERMQERDISRADVRKCIFTGEIIEDYPKDFPHPSCLIFGYSEAGRVLHTVVGTDGEFIFIITVYIPSREKFEADLKTRR